MPQRRDLTVLSALFRNGAARCHGHRSVGEGQRAADFWLTILRRLVHDYSHPLLVLFIILATLFFIDKKGRAGRRQVAPGFIAFAAGWLTFANVFTEHNYYQIPVTALLFISASIVLAHAVQELEPRVSQISTRLGGVPLRHAVILFMAAVAPILMIYGYRLSNYRAPDIFESAKYLLRDSRRHDRQSLHPNSSRRI
jgi:hypothetical protein